MKILFPTRPTGQNLIILSVGKDVWSREVLVGERKLSVGVQIDTIT